MPREGDLLKELEQDGFNLYSADSSLEQTIRLEDGSEIVTDIIGDPDLFMAVLDPSNRFIFEFEDRTLWPDD